MGGDFFVTLGRLRIDWNFLYVLCRFLKFFFFGMIIGFVDCWREWTVGLVFSFRFGFRWSLLIFIR